jgi:hypothetical protein
MLEDGTRRSMIFMHNVRVLIYRRPLYQHADPISYGGVQPIDNVLQPPNGGTFLKEATRIQGHEAPDCL